MKRAIRLICCILLLLAMGSVGAMALGDDVDYGGGGSDYSYSGDSGSYSWDYGDDDYASSSSSGGGGSGGLIFALICVGVILLSTGKKSGKLTSRQNMSRTEVDEDSLARLAEADPGFDRSEIERMVRQWVVDFEQAWSDGDMTPQKQNIGESLFNTYQAQLDGMRQSNERSVTKDLAVLTCEVKSWKIDGANEVLDVVLVERKRTYKVALDDPENVVKGSPHIRYQLTYAWQLTRPAREAAGDRGAVQLEKPGRWVLGKVDKLAQSSS